MRTPEDSAQDTSGDYVGRVNRAIDHILRNLDQPLKLEAVAQVACFSPFHFHRVFRSLIGETLGQFVKRLRLERAIRKLSHAPQASLTEIALDCGFASSSDFSRSFKQHYGVPPSAFDVHAFRNQRRDDWQAAIEDPKLRHQLDRLPRGENPDGFEVELRKLPAREVVYIRVLDPYRPGRVTAAAERLVEWAEERRLASGQWLGYMWDDPEIVAHEKCRYDVGLEVQDQRRVQVAGGIGGEVGRFAFPAMCVAQIEVRGGIDLEQRAIDWLFGTWLPASGFVPTDQPAFEAWIGRPFEHGFEHFELRVQLPVERA